MSFWIKVDVCEKGKVLTSTYPNGTGGLPYTSGGSLRSREGATVSQALRNMAAAMVYAKAETIEGASL